MQQKEEEAGDVSAQLANYSTTNTSCAISNNHIYIRTYIYIITTSYKYLCMLWDFLECGKEIGQGPRLGFCEKKRVRLEGNRRRNGLSAIAGSGR